MDWREIQRYTVQPVANGLGSVQTLIQTYLKVGGMILTEGVGEWGKG